MTQTLQIQNLRFLYPGQTMPALDGVSLQAAPGEFLTLCGPSGSGKSTLLRQLKPALRPHGVRSGAVLLGGTELDRLSPRDQCARIGFVQQSPEGQLVTDKVWHELAFGLESLGLPTAAIRSRVAEMAAFFGMEDWFERDVAQLSGGQKQLVNLAAVLALQPEVLLLDEPTAQLDPIAATEFLHTLYRVNRELGTTVLLSEHRLEEALPLSDRALILQNGRLLADAPPRQAALALRDAGDAMWLAMPAAARVWAAARPEGDCPMTVREGRAWLSGYARSHPLCPPALPAAPAPGAALAQLDGVWFRYAQDGPDVLRGMCLQVHAGECLAILGGNGAGKSTTLRLLAGLQAPQRGVVRLQGRAGLLPQNPQLLFTGKTLLESLDRAGASEQALARAVGLCRLEKLLQRHPYDLSGGEQQRAALAHVLLAEPELLLLDEPTKGLDAAFKQELGQLLQTLLRQGKAIVLVSHDAEFCAEYAGRCALCFRGAITACAPPREFFSANSFYTTAASRMSRALMPGLVTVPQLIAACTGAPPPAPPEPRPPASIDRPQPPPRLPRWRRILGALSGLTALGLLIPILRMTDFSAVLTPTGLTPLAGRYGLLYGAFLAALGLFALAVGRRREAPPQLPQARRRPCPRRTLAAAAAILLLIPLTIYCGVRFWDGRKYYFISLLILLEILLPFALVFEGRRPQARELALLASLCALAAAGRAAFFMLPECKPVVALVVLTGAALGAESGFLVGAMTMLTSNVLFGQGSWTPWQMFAMGLVGFFAGLLFCRGPLRPTRPALCCYGALASIVLYGGIMNPASALMWAHTLSWKLLLSYYLTGLPWDIVRAAATVIFLWLMANPMLEKLTRIQQKYGLLEP